MNNAYKKDNSVAKGGSRAPATHPRADSQYRAHERIRDKNSPLGYVKDTHIRSHATSSQKK